MRPAATTRRASFAVDAACLAALWVAMIVVAHPVGDFPINDDWVYAAAVRSLVTTGRFEVLSWSSANVGPFAWWGALFASLFGLSFTVLRASTLLCGLAGGLLVYALFHAVGARRPLALVAGAMVLADPVYFALSCTFMTDVPFFALVFAALLALVVGLRDGRERWIVVGLAIALVTVSMRQFAVVVLAGFALAHVARRGVGWRSVATGLLPLLGGLLLNAGFSRWLIESGRKPFPAGIESLLPSDTDQIAAHLEWSTLVVVSYLGLLTIPLVVAAHRDAPPEQRERVTVPVFFVMTIGLAIVYVLGDLVAPIGGNILTWNGIGPISNGDTMELKRNLPVAGPLASAAWVTLTAASIVAASFAVAVLVDGALKLARRVIPTWRRPRPPRDIVSLLLVGTGVSYFAILMLLSTTTMLFDRYLLPLVPLVGLALVDRDEARRSARPVGRARLAAAGALVLASAAFSVVATHDFFAWGRVRWAALERLMADGVAPTRIDGGYEFNGTYLYDPQYVGAITRNWYWVVGDEYATASGPLPGYRVLRVDPVERWWPDAGRDVFTLRR